ncbi:glycosyltransferase involved in cell wall biosynthesis [Chitinophaga skermanii]|uniref:Glycosyltransferase involved in cell wall biosynthesis n=1 Tax=Chitinophaga skermanii TaxID=331697 RepID=A0A327QVQ4_9BACT|nr:glycosyltransferase family 4 protein [Chitinophaga skermanii]RAJ08411.1 glycosyltransferase involved in cell wall biosynthesis [Chitinophaga skermanii]
MKIAYVASYPSRECGIATFTHHLVKAVSAVPNTEAMVIALNDAHQAYDYPPEVAYTIQQNDLDSYIAAADFINKSGAQICVIQHEFGIYGGESGIFVLPFIDKLQIPVMVTFHTVLKEPSYMQKTIVHQIGLKAQGIVVMSHLAIDFLEEVYDIPSHKISLIEHGVPEFCGIKDVNEYVLPELKDKKVLFTFGLLSRNKGIETVIKAMPSVVAKYPDVVYVIAGATHPGVIKHAGEEYRDSLKQLVSDLQLQDHVVFLNRFLDEDELCAYLLRCELYITPYLSESQITSGTLTYALGAGAVVLSTPYWYAKELLDDGRGVLFGFKQSEQLSNIILHLFDNPYAWQAIQKRAAAYGEHLQWSMMGQQYHDTAQLIVQEYQPTRMAVRNLNPFINQMPVLNFSHVRRITDKTGIIQHAKYGIPNLKEGYCVDDNARALMMLLMANQYRKSKDVHEMLPVYLSFINYMQREDGNFRNFLSFNLQYLDEIGSEDSFGRTVWALGYLIKFAPNHSYREFATDMFQRAIGHFKDLKYIRGHANTVIGVSYYLQYHPTDEGMFAYLQMLTNKLVASYESTRTDEWHWFEPHMTYDNGILPLALLQAYQVTGDEKLRSIGMESLRFLEKTTMLHDYFRPVGNNGWYEKDGAVPTFDQQAIETMAMVLLYQQAAAITNDEGYTKKMFTCFEWFLGRNSLGVPLYDYETHGCADGLQATGLNRNQGAESTLAFLISQLCVLRAQEPLQSPVRTTRLLTRTVTYNGFITVTNR